VNGQHHVPAVLPPLQAELAQGHCEVRYILRKSSKNVVENRTESLIIRYRGVLLLCLVLSDLIY
jgi:hypothetical protein